MGLNKVFICWKTILVCASYVIYISLENLHVDCGLKSPYTCKMGTVICFTQGFTQDSNGIRHVL